MLKPATPITLHNDARPLGRANPAAGCGLRIRHRARHSPRRPKQGNFRQRTQPDSGSFQDFQLLGLHPSRDAGRGRATWRPIAPHRKTLSESQPK
jgi:hypothetical protein